MHEQLYQFLGCSTMHKAEGMLILATYIAITSMYGHMYGYMKKQKYGFSCGFNTPFVNLWLYTVK